VTARPVSSTSGSVTAPQAPPATPRGLFDALLCVLLVYGVYAATPIGALTELAVRKALGQEHRPSLFATFRGRDTTVDMDTVSFDETRLARGPYPAAIVDAAQKSGVPTEVIAAVIAAHGTCDGKGCTVDTPPNLEVLLGESFNAPRASALDVGAALKKARASLGADPLLAVEALYVPPDALARAVSQAEATGLRGANELAVHAQFLSPGIRRGPMQNAVRVLALHRLQTLHWPVSSDKPITSPFGDRIHPVLKTKKFHNGTDIGIPTGTPLLSAHRGVIARASRDSVSGNYVKIDHGFGIETTYCHMSEIQVEEADAVEQAQVIGLSGATGRVTGPHLHYILRLEAKPVDPQAYGDVPPRRDDTAGS